MKRTVIKLIRKVLGAKPLPQDSWSNLRDFLDIHPTAIIGASATVSIPIRPAIPKIMITIGENAQIFGNLVLNNENAEIHIGNNTQIGASDLIAASKIVIGDDVIMSWGCTLLDSDNHSISWDDRAGDVQRARLSYIQTKGANIVKYHAWDKCSTSPILIGNRTFIGMNSVILKGVIVGDESVVGANTVIRTAIPPHTICFGNPAVVMGIIQDR